MIQASRRNIRELHPEVSEEELAFIFVELYYGKELAQRMQNHYLLQKALVDAGLAE